MAERTSARPATGSQPPSSFQLRTGLNESGPRIRAEILSYCRDFYWPSGKPGPPGGHESCLAQQTQTNGEPGQWRWGEYRSGAVKGLMRLAQWCIRVTDEAYTYVIKNAEG